MVIHDGITFGSGWYERGPGKSDAPAYTRAFVQQAMNLYVALGLEETVAYYNTKESVDGQWYVFIIDENQTIVAHAADPDLVGKHVSQALGPNSYPTGSAVAASADQDGAWFDYTYANPASGVVETKHSWMVIHDGITFGSGWYERGPGKSDAPAYTRAFVQQATNLYVALGLEETVAYYNTKESVDGQWYVFIIDPDGYTIAHHNRSFEGVIPASVWTPRGISMATTYRAPLRRVIGWTMCCSIRNRARTVRSTLGLCGMTDCYLGRAGMSSSNRLELGSVLRSASY